MIYTKYKTAAYANYQDLLKVLAIIAMVIDHVGFYFFPEHVSLRMIGRTAMPMFCFFAGYNFKGKVNPIILLYGLLLYVDTLLVHNLHISANILISIFLGQVYLFLTQNTVKNFYYSFVHVIFLALLFPVTKNLIDYGTISIAIMILGYRVQQDPLDLKLLVFAAMVLSVYHTLDIFMPAYNFTYLEVLAICIIAGLEYFLMVAKDFSERIAFNISFLSRNILFIYFAHYLLLESIFIYINSI